MTLLRRSAALVVSLLAWFALQSVGLAQLHEIGDGSPGPIKAGHVTAQLLAGAPAIAPGGSTSIALALQLESGWHVYWIDAGDSGEAPTVDWMLPSGVSVGKMQFPAPKRLPLGPLMDYGYEGTAVFPFDLHADNSLQTSGHIHSVDLRAHVRWLVCREVCVPGKAFLGITLPIASTQPPLSSRLIAQAIAAEPVSLPAGDLVRVSGTRTTLTMTIETGRRETRAELFPFDENSIRNAAEQNVEFTWKGAQITLERGDISDVLPNRLEGVVELDGGRAYLINAAVQPARVVSAKTAGTRLGFGLAILLAFGGGLVLNLMPCVFPVLFLKALSLVDSTRQSQRVQTLSGLSYTAGILVSFWIIVTTLLISRAVGRQVGWGFQLQSPTFVALLALLLFLMGLALAGQFELGLSFTGRGDALTRKGGYTGSFFTGMLATVVATPCTAPLMGAAVGYALSQSALVTLAIFTALALGLALPYQLLTLQPAWAKLMPRPGRWMETLKQLTAVPLLLTVVWLVWVYGRLYSAAGEDIDHVARLLVGFLLLAGAGWALRRWPAQRVGLVAAALLVASSVGVSLTAAVPDRLAWKAFSPAALQEARAGGRPVFVDFTAAWCLSCQVNERVVLHDAAVERELTAKHYIMLRADWTRYDPEITGLLDSVGRDGVPTYVVFPSQPDSKALVLPELLTRSEVLNALGHSGT
jgi:DsbC/DsbD-like thiol-disulfide interchange protein/cytochrome c biogenesis protein CcdA